MIEINKAYVINLSHRTDRWEEIQKKFANTGIELVRWDAVYGKKLDDKLIKDMTTPFCYNFCSYGMIGCWLSHLTLWYHIVENNETNILILEDDAEPVENFNEILKETLRNLPKDWEFLYLGYIYGNMSEANLIKKINDKHDIITLREIYGTHAYILTNECAHKLISDEDMNKVSYHIDHYLSHMKFPKKEIKVYCVNPSIINQSTSQSDNISYKHPIIQDNILGDSRLGYDLGIEIANIRKCNLSVTRITLTFFLLSLFVGIINNTNSTYLYIILTIIFFIFELTSSNNMNTLLFDYIILLLGLLCGIFINNIASRKVVIYN
jgi:glycosyl transferase family 25